MNFLIHVFTGTVALATGAVALMVKKGRTWHIQTGRIYVWCMTFVFITGIILAVERTNRFLFLIAFLSYYSVFTGYRILKYKQLHNNQKVKKPEWIAGIINTMANILFVGMGLYFLLRPEPNLPGAILSVGFGVGGIVLSYTNLRPFLVRPEKPYHWYLSHMGNMMGGYIATFTAFTSTMVTRYDIANPVLVFIIIPILGLILSTLWVKKKEKKFERIDIL